MMQKYTLEEFEKESTKVLRTIFSSPGNALKRTDTLRKGCPRGMKLSGISIISLDFEDSDKKGFVPSFTLDKVKLGISMAKNRDICKSISMFKDENSLYHLYTIGNDLNGVATKVFDAKESFVYELFNKNNNYSKEKWNSLSRQLARGYFKKMDPPCRRKIYSESLNDNNQGRKEKKVKDFYRYRDSKQVDIMMKACMNHPDVVAYVGNAMMEEVANDYIVAPFYIKPLRNSRLKVMQIYNPVEFQNMDLYDGFIVIPRQKFYKETGIGKVSAPSVRKQKTWPYINEILRDYEAYLNDELWNVSFIEDGEVEHSLHVTGKNSRDVAERILKDTDFQMDVEYRNLLSSGDYRIIS